MFDQIVVTDDGGIRIIRMNRPEKKNALTQPMYAAMTLALCEAVFAGARDHRVTTVAEFLATASGGR